MAFCHNNGCCLFSSKRCSDPPQLEPAFIKGKGLSFRNFHKRRGSPDFHHKKGGVCKIGIILKRKVSLIFILINPFQCYLSECLVCVCVLSICNISISIVCFSREELTLIESNQQIHDFCKRVIYKAKALWKLHFWYHQIILSV